MSETIENTEAQEAIMKKYELLPDDTVTTPGGKTLHRIRALVTIAGIVAAGELGGYIESEKNLSQVYGNAWVYGNARVSGDAWVYGDARISGDAWVYGDARVYGNAWVSGNAQVYGNTWVYGDAQVYGNAWVYGNARVSGDAWVYGDAQVYGNAWVYGNARVSGDAWVYGNARVYGDARVSGDAWVYGDAQVYGNARVSGDAELTLRLHLGWFSHVGSEDGTLTWFREKDGGVRVNRGCFNGTLDEFEAKVTSRHGDSQHAREYRHLIEFIRMRASSFAPAVPVES